jgi:hypothetical protein
MWLLDYCWLPLAGSRSNFLMMDWNESSVVREPGVLDVCTERSKKI